MTKRIVVLALLLIMMMLTGCGSSSEELPVVNSEGVTDISNLSFFMEYNQLYNIVNEWKAYENQPIKLKCKLDKVENFKGYSGYLCIIPDGSGCCSINLELIFREEIEKVPKNACILGTFHSYVRDGYRYCQIIDAEVAE